MKPEDIDRHSRQLVHFVAMGVLTQAEALAVAADVLNEKGVALLKAHPYFQGLDEV